MNIQHRPGRQQGVVLIVSLIFLLLLAILATTVSETNILQLRMAGNDESKMEATQRALAIVDAILDEGTNVPVVGDVGYRICDEDSSSPTLPSDCKEYEITIPSDLIVDAGVVKYHVERAGPLEAPAPYLDEDIAIGAGARVATQKIVVTVDRLQGDRGAVELVQGYLRLIISGGTIVSDTTVIGG